MITKSLTQNEILERRKKFFEEINKEYPRIVGDFIVTSSGIIEPKPETQEAWESFHENLQFVDGIERGG